MVKPNDKITDGTVEWTVRSIKRNSNNDGNPTGIILAFAGNGVIPDGYLLCDGSEISRIDYIDLFDAIGETYGVGDGSTTFNLPNIINNFLEGSNNAGEKIAAGLPNITGTLIYRHGVCYTSNGCFYHSSHLASFNGTIQNTPGYTHGNFDASRSTKIYGSSKTVQPPAITVIFLIKY